MDKVKLDRALANLILVQDRLINKYGSSTTGAQAHLGLITKCNSDIEEVKALMAPPTVSTRKSKV